jgi:hypothetical protein
VAVRNPARSVRRLWVVGASVAVAVAVFVLVWFQPQKLWIDDEVDDALPVPAESAGRTADAASPVDVRRGSFISRDHGTAGRARVIDVGDERVLRLEGLDTDNGPDLYVYLTTTSASGAEQSFDDDVVNLGRLKGNRGDQNYELPPGVDLDRYATVVIWCDRFNSAFGAADLS